MKRPGVFADANTLGQPPGGQQVYSPDAPIGLPALLSSWLVPALDRLMATPARNRQLVKVSLLGGTSPCQAGGRAGLHPLFIK